MKSALATAAVLVGSIATGQALAGPTQLRPGLWEHRFTMESQSGEMERSMQQMQEELANMPPEQRKMMEQMMASQGVQVGPGGHSVRICLSQEQAARGMVPQQDGNCRQEVVKRSGNTIKYRFNCTGNPPSSGEGEVTIISPTAYTGKSIVNTTVNGQPDRITMEQSGKWLSDDCGNIKSRK